MANHYDSIPELRTANKDSEGGELAVGSVNWAQYLYTDYDGSEAWDQGLQVTSTKEFLQQGDLSGKAGWGAPILYFDTCLRDLGGAELPTTQGFRLGLSPPTAVMSLKIMRGVYSGPSGGAPGVRRAYVLQSHKDEALAAHGLGFSADSAPVLTVAPPLPVTRVEGRKRVSFEPSSCFAGACSCFKGIF
jgi:hypothetical protein